jgi:hypothetical protein
MWRSLLQNRKSGSQPGGIELIYGEHADAALRAAGSTDQPLSTPMSGVGQRGIHNLDQRVIPGR